MEICGKENGEERRRNLLGGKDALSFGLRRRMKGRGRKKKKRRRKEEISTFFFFKNNIFFLMFSVHFSNSSSNGEE